jgi:hypothetical protein
MALKAHSHVHTHAKQQTSTTFTPKTHTSSREVGNTHHQRVLHAERVGTGHVFEPRAAAENQAHLVEPAGQTEQSLQHVPKLQRLKHCDKRRWWE